MIECHDCTACIQNNAWAKTNAQKAGWFFEKAGPVYCPQHVPDWVAGWRARQTALLTSSSK